MLQTLSEQIKLSETPEILFSFADKFFDDRYKSVLLEMLAKEPAAVLTPQKVNVLSQ